MRKRFYSSFKEVDMPKQRNPAKESDYDHYSRRHRSPSPYRQESSKRPHTGFTDRSPEDDYKAFRSPPRESLQRNSYKRNSACSPPDDEQFRSRSFLKEQKETNYSIPTETKSQEPESKSGGLRDFIPELHALPTEIFLKIVLLKLDEMNVEGFAELSELAKFINNAQEVFAKTLPPEIEAVVRQMMFSKVGMNFPKVSATQPGNTQVSESRRERKDLPSVTDFSLIRDILNQANRKDTPSASSNVASHQNVLPYPGSTYGNVNSPYTNTYTPSSNESYSYNTASSSMTPGIPGLTLTEEQRESYSAYNAYQSQYSEPSLSNYHNFKF